MGWRTMAVRDQRVRFVVRANQGEESFSALCEEFDISRPTGYRWLRRYHDQGVSGIEERSRRPHGSPERTPAAIEQQVVGMRRQRPDWGARKLQALLERQGTKLATRTVHRILVRHDLVREDDSHRPAPRRFEREAPNQLWQMDFKSPKGWQRSVGPLSVLDDHSRYVVALAATGSTQGEAVRERLESAFLECGLPEEMLMDHGIPWWNAQAPSGWTRLSVWLMKQGIRCWFSGYGHPQTQGKVERFHGALEMARRRRGLPSAEQHQAWLDEFREEYNHLRPHEALGGQTPASAWYPSTRRYHPHPPEWDYGTGAEVQRLGANGQLKLQRRWWQVSEALAYEPVQLVRVEERVLVYYCQSLLREIDLADQRSTPVERWSQPSNCKGCGGNAV
jgi:transposase InsO family protein